ncbi:hypothetical protein Q765_20090 [Flavobacterium rivuli WB 3.3-2 = DSM 21788]|uniref:Plasmid stabilization protein n=1 Tax=Flavobacterium rivuli WB 3.3-2 = DSM 21788 TaxID=1121895 RepID=A0A0A2M8V8_9FLAO|nr:type II toxin-antitoxin system RelE/ParE family toxin [Flavobacterium rivuli]KGO84710.1 hypothetical protein Q765_20090 [Flavobacterium rivuli WB 3.3-2 = DSM 21788]
MSKEIIWSSAAENDLIKILDYLNLNWNTKVTNSFLDILGKNISQVSFTPDLFPVFNKSLNIRKCVITKHNTLYYENHYSEIVILRIYDVRQNPDKLKF